MRIKKVNPAHKLVIRLRHGDIRNDSRIGVGSIRIEFAFINDKGAVDFPGYTDYRQLRSLGLYAQWDLDPKEERTYAWKATYSEIFTVDLSAAEMMVKVLREIDRACQRFPVRPTTFGQWVQMLAQAMHLDCFIDSRPITMQILRIDEIQGIIDHAIRTSKPKPAPVPQEVTSGEVS
jgi:hypothetical protein